MARKSSTSLTGAGEGGDDDDDDDDDGGGGGGDYAYSQEWNWERARSMRGSGAMLQGQSRGQSRSGSIGGGGGRVGEEEEGEERGEEEIRPDFVDVEEGEEEGEEVDEGEMKRVVMGRVGGWVDWAVGWMDFRGEGEEEGDVDEAEADRAANDEDGEAVTKGELDLVELQKRLRKKKRKDDEAETGGEGLKTMSSAPEQAGVWSDAKWLLGVATKVAYE